MGWNGVHGNVVEFGSHTCGMAQDHPPLLHLITLTLFCILGTVFVDTRLGGLQLTT